MDHDNRLLGQGYTESLEHCKGAEEVLSLSTVRLPGLIVPGNTSMWTLRRPTKNVDDV
jgi:hypothetical protein